MTEEAALILVVTDPGDEYTLSVLGGLPDGSMLEEVSEGEFVFRWTLQQVMYEPLVFIANDSRGAASTFIPTVEICACVNGGMCTRAGIITNNATILLNCQCTEGKKNCHDPY